MKIGMFAGAFKPFTKGHYAVIEKASNENNRVLLFVSTGDRKRKNEFPISWGNMEPIWKKYIEPILPSNVEVHYVPNPMTSVMDLLDHINEKNLMNNDFYLYSDSEDLEKRFKNKRVQDRYSFLFDSGILNLVPLPRLKNASGTKARKYLELGLENEFVNELPMPMQKHGSEIFTYLGAKKV